MGSRLCREIVEIYYAKYKKKLFDTHFAHTITTNVHKIVYY